MHQVSSIEMCLSLTLDPNSKQAGTYLEFFYMRLTSQTQLTNLLSGANILRKLIETQWKSSCLLLRNRAFINVFARKRPLNHLTPLKPDRIFNTLF